MSEPSKDMGCAVEHNSVVPDYFGYYSREVAELLSRDEDFLPFSSNTSEFVKDNEMVSSIDAGPLFSDASGAEISDVKKERLRTMLLQSVVILSREVDEMLDPVIGMCRLKARIRQKKSQSYITSAISEEDAEQHPHKKPKRSSSLYSGSGDEHIVLAVPGKDLPSCSHKQCTTCHKIENCNKETGPGIPKFLCDACAKQANEFLSNKDQMESYLGSTVAVDDEKGEIEYDLLLLENGGPDVEEKIMKYSDGLSTTLECMQRKLEELLDIVMSSFRPMTHLDKQQLQRTIRNLPPKNLDRVVEILHPRTTLEKGCPKEVLVNLEDEDNATLWRLYYYVKAYKKARKL